MRTPDKVDTGLYETRKAVFPSKVDGRFRRLKWAVMLVTLGIYYLTPWIRWDRGPYSPDQAVLIDLAHRRFYIFSIEIWPQEFYFVAGLLIMAGIGLFLITSAVGRAWCGYSCPQTVWTDLFQHVDRLIDGDRNAQMRLQNAPWSASKIARRLFKWSVYLLIGFSTGGAWILYFADAPTLFRDFWAGSAASVAYATVFVLTVMTVWFGAFMREQVCIYMCPWPRIQSAMLDEKSLIVTYKDWRGEPRGSVKKAEKNPGGVGDCIDCHQCVNVCPTGYDIRKGPDIACITCALCIDACDNVMKQIGRPRGLIDYATLEDSVSEKAGNPPTSHLKLIWHPRTLAYFAVWCAIGVGLLFALGTRKHIDLAIQKDRNPPYMLLSNGEIRNAWTMKFKNMEGRPRSMTVSIQGLPDGTMWSDTMSREAAARELTLMVPADTTMPVRVYVAGKANTTPQDFTFVLKANDKDGGGDSSATHFDAPGEE